MDGAGLITFQNAAAAHILGARPGELIGTSVMEIIHPEDLPTAMASLATLNANMGMLLPDEVRMKRQDTGEYVYLETRGVNLAEHPEVLGIVVNFRDVSRQREAARALAQSEQRLELAIGAAELGLWNWNVPAEEISYYGSLAELLGLEPGEPVPASELMQAIHPGDLPTVKAVIQAHLAGETAHLEVEHRLLYKDGMYRWIASRGQVVERDTDGKPTRMVGTHLNVQAHHQAEEERAALEDRLQLAHRMESIGQLAGGVAHDFNNALQVIIANALMARDSDDAELTSSALEEIAIAGERASQLTRQLLAFGRRQTLAPRPCDVNELLTRALKVLRPAIPERIEIELRQCEHSNSAFLDPNQFDQVLTNLCVNARDAMPRGGKLTIAVEDALVNREYQRHHPWARPGRYVVVSVTDTGVGMSPEVKDKAFEPFFTTKQTQGGSGLGLSMVHGTVQQHGGLVHLYSELGVGTTIKVFWPAAERPAETVGNKLQRAVPQGSETILVVEDDQSVRTLVARTLRTNGYRVLLAADGEEGLEVFRREQDRIDLVLLDAVMPRLSGREAYTEIQRLQSKPVLFTSGYSADVLPAEFLAQQSLRVLQEPYAPDLLLRQVREVLDDREVHS